MSITFKTSNVYPIQIGVMLPGNFVAVGFLGIT